MLSFSSSRARICEYAVRQGESFLCVSVMPNYNFSKF